LRVFNRFSRRKKTVRADQILLLNYLLALKAGLHFKWFFFKIYNDYDTRAQEFTNYWDVLADRKDTSLILGHKKKQEN
jgi:hypothetical protein